MRTLLAPALAVALVGCASPLASEVAFSAVGGAKVQETFVARFAIRNDHAEAPMVVNASQFHLRAGTALFTCVNSAWVWRLVDTPHDATRPVTLAPGERLDGYVLVGLCPDAAGPYTLVWQGRGKGEWAEDEVPLRPFEYDVNASESPSEAIALFARAWGESGSLSG